MLADLPPPRRLAQREPGPQGSSGGRTRSPAAQRWSASSGKSAGEPRMGAARWAGEAWQQARWKVWSLGSR